MHPYQHFPATGVNPGSTVGTCHRDIALPETPTTTSDSLSTTHRVKVTKNRPSLQDVDGLATVASPQSISEERFFGRSSTIGFLRHLDQFTGGHRPTVPASNESISVNDPYGPQSKNGNLFQIPIREIHPNTFVYPPRSIADNYVHLFWEYIHPVFPVLHKPSFMSDYNKLWLSGSISETDSASDLLFPSTLNVVFALGCQYSDAIEPSQKSSVASEFYQRARRVAAFDMLDSTSIIFVQHLLLMAIYLQSTSSASSCWNSIGLAIRVAQSLCLDLEPTRPRSETQLEQEMRRRVWHVCTVLDRLLSMTFGRPPMVLIPRAVPLPQMIDDEYLKEEGEGIQPPESPSRLGLLSYSSQLLEILHDVLTTLYQDGRDNVPGTRKAQQDFQKTLTQALELNDRLDVFTKDIPDYLKPDSVANIPHISLQQRVLFCRTCIVRILILRPILLTTIEQGVSDPTVLQTVTQSSTLTRHLVESACNLCIDTAHRLIESLWLHLENTYRSSSWHTVYFAFNAAVILLAATLSPVVKVSGTDQHFSAPWDHALIVLERYREQVPCAGLAIRTLQSFRSRINQRQARASTTSESQSQRSGLEFTTGMRTVMDDPIFEINFDDFDYSQFGSMNDAWFSQQVVNMDWFGST